MSVHSNLFKQFDMTRPWQMPTRGTVGSAGYDLYCSESIVVGAGMTKIKTNTAVAIPKDHVGLIMCRSGLAAKGMIVSGGVIDSDYEGELMVIACYLGSSLGFVEGDRVAQLLIVKISPTEDDGCGVARGTGGFGSTGA